jgi:hypothetical protein
MKPLQISLRQLLIASCLLALALGIYLQFAMIYLKFPWKPSIFESGLPHSCIALFGCTVIGAWCKHLWIGIALGFFVGLFFAVHGFLI